MLCVGEISAQSSLKREVTLSPFKVDSSYSLGDWIIPETIQVFDSGNPIDSNVWEFNDSTNLWSIKPNYQIQFNLDSEISLKFESYPFSFQRFYQNREEQEIDSSYYNFENDSLKNELIRNSETNVFDDSNLEQRGSLSRGIIVGTNQDFALESGLQFELSGQLTDDVSINASLTDKSIPIQPDGTTQNLREFDRVFIQLQSKNTRVEMGDVDVSFEQSTFARLNRRLQGAAGYTNSRFGNYNGALSVVRGTFKTRSFLGQDGVQGPYRLTGRDGEEFVIVLAGTERVFINGQQAERGEEYDYIIDYGLGEVFFTNNLLIKDETRIVIEYEYVDQNFNRTLVAAEAKDELLNGKFKLSASVIRQADGDELLSQQALTEDDIDILRGLGDNIDQAIVSGERTVGNDDESNVRYAKIDTVYNGISYSIFKHVPNSVEAIYVVRFSKIENGSYRRISGAVNGLLYEWIGPGLGDYEPFRRLPSPEKQQMVALNSAFNVTKNFEWFGEWAASSYDKNRFSSLDDNDNNDVAYLTGLKLNELNSSLGKVSASFSRRYSGERFQYFERTQEIEFDRRWNVNRTNQSKEAINEAKFQLSPTSNTDIISEFGYMNRSGYEGYRQGSVLRSFEPGIVSATYTQDWIRTEDSMFDLKGNWFRHLGKLEKVIGKWTPYLGFEQEQKIEKSVSTDSLQNTSFSFYEMGPGLKYTSTDLKIDARIVYRFEKGVLYSELIDRSSAIEQRLEIDYRPNSFIGTQNEIAIRSKKFTTDFNANGSSNRRGLLVRSVTDYESKSEFLNGQVFYEANTERRALLQEAYLEVGPELGQFVWIDTNDDGVQQIDEFFPELSQNEGIYVRQYLPSDNLLPVIDLKTIIRNEIRPFSFLENKFLSNIQLRSRIDITENSTTNELRDVYLLNLKTFRNDSTTIQGRFIWEKELDVLPEVYHSDLRIGYNENRSLSQRSTDSQELFSSSFYVSSLTQITERSRISVDFNRGLNNSTSDKLSSRNFSIDSRSISPGIMMTINRSWQSSLSISYTQKKDRYPSEPVVANMYKIINSNRAFLFKKLQANSRIELRNTAVKGSSSSLGTFELTEGTGIGMNVLWSFTGSYRLNDLIRISFNYDGRTVANKADIHTLKLVVSAVF